MKRVMMKKHRNPLTTSSRFPNRRIWLKELISVFLNDFHTSLGSDHPRSSYKTAIAGLEVARDPTKYFTDQLCSACWIFLSVCEALFLHISQGPIASLVQIPVDPSGPTRHGKIPTAERRIHPRHPRHRHQQTEELRMILVSIGHIPREAMGPCVALQF